MPKAKRKLATAKGSANVILTETALAAITELPQLEAEPWWNQLTTNEQKLVRDEDEGVAQDIMITGRARLSLGQRFKKLREVLEPKGVFERYCSGRFQMSVRSVYRYIDDFDFQNKILPAPVLRVAIVRGYDLVRDPARLQRVIDKMPPPSTDDPVAAEDWLRQAKKVSRAPAMIGEIVDHVSMTFEIALKQSFRFVALRYGQLPPRARKKYMENLLGMLITKFGVSNPITIHPLAIPPEFIAQVGRPSKKVLELGVGPDPMAHDAPAPAVA